MQKGEIKAEWCGLRQKKYTEGTERLLDNKESCDIKLGLRGLTGEIRNPNQNPTTFNNGHFVMVKMV